MNIKQSRQAQQLAALLLVAAAAAHSAQVQAQGSGAGASGSGATGNGASSGMAPHPSLPGSEMNRHDPLAIYKQAGIDGDQEKKIRQFAKDFEDSQRVRLKLMANLLREMRALQMQPDPDEKKALSKQDQINQVQDEMGTERIKLVLKIRSIMNFDQKQRLVQIMAGSAGGAAQEAK